MVNGVNRDYEVSVFPLNTDGNKVHYAVEVVKDITPVSKGNALPQIAGKLTSRDKNFTTVFDTMAQWAMTTQRVLVKGEKGTGKKSFARALHQRSAGRIGPSVFSIAWIIPKAIAVTGFSVRKGPGKKAKGGNPLSGRYLPVRRSQPKDAGGKDL